MKNNFYTMKEQLELFSARVDEIRETQLIKNGFKSSFSISSNFVEGSIEVLGLEPDEEDLRSFLTIYRKFISNDSPIFINKIFNICQLKLNDIELKNNLIEARQSWKDEFQKGFMILDLNQRVYTPEKILDLWINAVYFHDDLEKVKMLESIMPNVISYTIVRQVFLSLICETTKVIIYVGNTISFGFTNHLFNLQETK